MTAPTLNPCPFCGSARVSADMSWAVCEECEASGPYGDSERDFAGWNSLPRPTPPSPDGRQLARVRIAVAVDEGGRWVAEGAGYASGKCKLHHEVDEASVEFALRCFTDGDDDPAADDKRAHVVWVTASVPLPPLPVEGEVEPC